MENVAITNDVVVFNEAVVFAIAFGLFLGVLIVVTNICSIYVKKNCALKMINTLSPSL
jgi:ABC-type methionine transport system permease subunit